MIKRIIKILLATLLISILVISYLSIFGLKTDKFNNQIIKNISKINDEINISLKEVKYVINPFKFSINIKTKNPKISFKGKKLEIKSIKTNLALKSLINDQFSINYLQFQTKEIKINDAISLGRIFYNSPQFFILDTIIKDGFITINGSLNFNNKGKIKENYKIEGSIKEAKLNILNQFILQNFNFNFNIDKDVYLLKKIDMLFNDIKIVSPLIRIKEEKDLFFVNGQFSSDNKNFDIERLKKTFSNLPILNEIQKIEFSSNNIFSLNVNKKLKFNNFKIKSNIDLKQLIVNETYLKLDSYFTSFIEEIKFTDHKITIDYDKKKFDLKGEGSFFLEEKVDNFSYQIIKDKVNILFDSKINLENNPLLIDFLNYRKKEGLNSIISIKGKFNKDNQLSFDLINLKENDNEIFIKNLKLNKNFKIIDIENFNINYRNDRKILNNLNLKKEVNSSYSIKGESFDASRIIDNIMDNDKENSPIFKNLNSKINIRIKKTYIDKINYLDNLYGDISYVDNKIDNLKLESNFPNKKKINLSIETKSNSEVITKLFSSYPKPLIKRYKFIKGFEEGYLDFYSSKNGGVSNSVLIIDNFKVKEVPIFAKLLSLASLQGMADLLTGEGIRFTDFEMNFSNQKDVTKIDEMYAIGPAVSILMEGYIESNKLVSLRGTLVPATTINRSIASIPLLGKILIGDKAGEGVFGVSFKIKGPPKNLKTSVNPIKTLTPRFITRTLEKIKKN